MNNSRLPDPAFWKGRDVFITGHTGFKGTWLSLILNCLGAQVHGYSLEAPTNPNMHTVANMAARMSSSSIADIRSREELKGALLLSESSVAFHLAAQSLVLRSYCEPVETYDVNVTGTASFLEAVRFSPATMAAVIVTSDKCYENLDTGGPYRETDRLGGFDPYSSSKACAELVVDSFRSSFFSIADSTHSQHLGMHKGIASARAGNVIGGGDWSEFRIVPDCVKSLLVGKSLTVRNPSAVRPWQHVIEPLMGYLILAESLIASPRQFSQGWNFGPDDVLVRSVEDLVELIRIEIPNSPSVVKEDALSTDFTARPRESNVLKLDCAKSKKYLRWHPALGFEETVSMTMEWYKVWLQGEDMYSFSQAQVEKYYSKFQASKI